MTRKKTVKGFAVLGMDQLAEFTATGRIPLYATEEQKLIGSSRSFKLFQKDISFDDLKYLYQRCDIARNVVDIPANDVFSKWFEVKAYEGEEENKALEDAIWEINRDLKVKQVFLEAYTYSRLYGLGIVVLGLKSSSKKEDPPEDVSGIDYLVAFSGAEIESFKFDEDLNSPTYGEITHYIVKIKSKYGHRREKVHASRVIHVMERTLDRSPWGLSALEPVFDLLQALKNIDWAATEAYLQNASKLFVLSYEGVPTEGELDAAKEDLEKINVTTRYIKPKSWELTTVTGSGELPSPGEWWNPIVERIAGGTKVPKTILLGVSAGALASSETNLAQYYKDIAAIQSDFVEPILMEFYRRLQEWKILPEGDFDLVWNPLWEMDAKEQAEIAESKIRSASTAVGSGTPIMTVDEARKVYLGLDPLKPAGTDTLRIAVDEEEGRWVTLEDGRRVFIGKPSYVPLAPSKSAGEENYLRGRREGVNWKVHKDIPAEKVKVYEDEFDKLPPGQRRAAREIILESRSGDAYTVGGEEFRASGEYEPNFEKAIIYQAGGREELYMKASLRHETGHAVWHKLEQDHSPEGVKLRQEFSDAVDVEGGFTYYAELYIKESPQRAVDESFADASAYITPRSMAMYSSAKPKIVEGWKKIMSYVNEAAGEG